ncbi:MAG: hypothetical protein WBE63_02740 [Acidobacteriaceae bacterium]
MPEPITISPEAAIPTQPTPKPQCRAIRTDGHRCRGIALAGLHLCYAHYHHRFPSLADPDHLSVPLLEDAASIQLLMTQVAHGLLSNKLDPARARTAIWAAQVAAYTLPRPARLKDPEPQGDPVHRIGFDHESLISADTAPGENLANLNYLCHAPATTDEIWETLDTPHSVNQPPIDQRYIDPWHCAPPPQPIPAQYNVPPPPPPVPRPNHESGLPCHCPPCEERLQSHIRRFEVRPRKRSVPTIDNPLCPSGNPTCLGPASEFACRSCRRLRNSSLANLDTDSTNDPDPVPDSRCPDPGPGVIPDSRYPEDSAK